MLWHKNLDNLCIGAFQPGLALIQAKIAPVPNRNLHIFSPKFSSQRRHSWNIYIFSYRNCCRNPYFKSFISVFHEPFYFHSAFAYIQNTACVTYKRDIKFLRKLWTNLARISIQCLLSKDNKLPVIKLLYCFGKRKCSCPCISTSKS